MEESVLVLSHTQCAQGSAVQYHQVAACEKTPKLNPGSLFLSLASFPRMGF